MINCRVESPGWTGVDGGALRAIIVVNARLRAVGVLGAEAGEPFLPRGSNVLATLCGFDARNSHVSARRRESEIRPVYFAQ